MAAAQSGSTGAPRPAPNPGAASRRRGSPPEPPGCWAVMGAQSSPVTRPRPDPAGRSGLWHTGKSERPAAWAAREHLRARGAPLGSSRNGCDDQQDSAEYSGANSVDQSASPYFIAFVDILQVPWKSLPTISGRGTAFQPALSRRKAAADPSAAALKGSVEPGGTFQMSRA